MNKIQIHKDLEQNEYIILELDTTGSNPDTGAEIVRIVALKIKNNNIIDRFCKCINPNKGINSKIKEMYKLSDDDVKEAQASIIVLDDFYEWAGISKEYLLIISENYDKILRFLNYYNDKNFKIVPRIVGYDFVDLIDIFETEYNNGKKIDIEPLFLTDDTPYNLVLSIKNICSTCLNLYEEDKHSFNYDTYNKEFIIMDIETSGLEPTEGAEVIRIAAYKIKNKKISDKFFQLITLNMLLSDEIKEITNISNEELIKYGITYKEAILKFYNWWGNMPAVTFNLPFLCKFIKYYDEKYLIDDYNKSRCFELRYIVRQKFKDITTRSPKKMLKTINPNYLNKLQENQFYYLDIMWYLVNKVYKEEK